MATHGQARNDTITALENRYAFRRSGFAMWATDRKQGTGEMPKQYAAQYRAADVVYTVMSYATPILWITRDGEIVSPRVSYSATTSQHQGLARTYV